MADCDIFDTPGAGTRPEAMNSYVAEGLSLGPHTFVISPLPCCAKIALPYWARVIGSIVNDEADEACVKVTVRLFDENRNPIHENGDFMIIDGKETGEFDVKIVDFLKEARTYDIEVKRLADVSEFE